MCVSSRNLCEKCSIFSFFFVCLFFIYLKKGLCLSHMLFIATSHKKKHESWNNVSPLRNHDIHYFCGKSVFGKKPFHAITHKQNYYNTGRCSKTKFTIPSLFQKNIPKNTRPQPFWKKIAFRLKFSTTTTKIKKT